MVSSYLSHEKLFLGKYFKHVSSVGHICKTNFLVVCALTSQFHVRHPRKPLIRNNCFCSYLLQQEKSVAASIHKHVFRLNATLVPSALLWWHSASQGTPRRDSHGRSAMMPQQYFHVVEEIGTTFPNLAARKMCCSFHFNRQVQNISYTCKDQPYLSRLHTGIFSLQTSKYQKPVSRMTYRS